VVKGKARKPTTQGSIEVSHKAFKEALVTWCNKTGSDDWVYGCFIVQNEVNHRPMRTRGNISPHTLYYGAAPNNSYSTVLGQAYSKATTEFGLRLPKKVLTLLADYRPDVLASQQQIEEMISIGDHLWNICSRDDTPPVESEQMLFAGVRDILKEDFAVELEGTTTMTYFEEETIGELHQEELVWKEETETMVRDETRVMDDYEWFALDGSDEDKKPAAKVVLSVETDDLMEGKGIVFCFRFPVIFNTVFYKS
jgi:hypothetical protein